MVETLDALGPRRLKWYARHGWINAKGGLVCLRPTDWRPIVSQGPSTLTSQPVPAATEPGGADGPSIAEVAAKIAKTIADEEWNKVPPDLASTIDQRLYGSPDRPPEAGEAEEPQ